MSGVTFTIKDSSDILIPYTFETHSPEHLAELVKAQLDALRQSDAELIAMQVS